MMQTPQNEAAQPKPRERYTFGYWLAMGLSIFLFHTLFPVRYHGAEQAAALDAPYLLIGNHYSMLDPLLIGWKCPRYQIRYLGKKELTKSRLMAALYANMLMIPVDRHNMDMHAVRACLKTLKEGHVLGIFPEGTRHKQTLMEEMESGMAMIALQSKATILPAYIASRPRLFRRTDCYYGQTISAADFLSGGINKEACDALMRKITEIYQQMETEHKNSIRRQG